jgi:hypothetical protein
LPDFLSDLDDGGGGMFGIFRRPSSNPSPYTLIARTMVPTNSSSPLRLPGKCFPAAKMGPTGAAGLAIALRAPEFENRMLFPSCRSAWRPHCIPPQRLRDPVEQSPLKPLPVLLNNYLNHRLIGLEHKINLFQKMIQFAY